jgi:hypothetical protein
VAGDGGELASFFFPSSLGDGSRAPRMMRKTKTAPIAIPIWAFLER